MDKSALKDQIASSLTKTRLHLEYSFAKVQTLDLDGQLDNETLETLESFASRFSRFSDIAISQYLRLLVLEQDPAFRGSVRDTLNQAEKFGWVASAADWVRIRELRKLAAHEYSPEDFRDLYRELIATTPTLLKLRIA